MSTTQYGLLVRALDISVIRYCLSEELYTVSLSLGDNLREINIKTCYQLRDYSLSRILRTGSLERIYFEENRFLTDESLAEIARYCPNVVVLSVQRCPEFSTGLFLVAERCLKLEELIIIPLELFDKRIMKEIFSLLGSRLSCIAY
ncbi:hypothetical protein K7432_012822 [Basidiobolus ranarum]|uniref:Uncharacterized protein n=1 Tax=Basidiobolus ranarum TaxID=34480 RepID=A0ABR2VRN6_9FUNG